MSKSTSVEPAGILPATQPPQDSNAPEKLSLPMLVSLGLAVSLVTIFLLSWYFSQQEWLNSCKNSCGSWKVFPPLNQQQMFGVIRNSVTAGAALGLGVTLVLSYRRQRVAEKTLVFTSETQRIAVEAQKLAELRLERDGLDTLRGRYLDIAGLLNKDTAFAQITALHALESLTTSWRQFGIDREANASVGLLLSTARLSKAKSDPLAIEFRQTTWRTLDRHMREGLGTSQHWGTLNIDATACLSTSGISNWTIAGGEFIGSPLEDGFPPIRAVRIDSGALRIYGSPSPGQAQTRSSSLKPLWPVSRLELNGGRLILHATPLQERGFRIVFTRCEFNLGVFSLSTPAMEGYVNSELSFMHCIFRDGRIAYLPGRATRVAFVGCEFENSPIQITQSLIDSGLSFRDCSTQDGQGDIQAIESVDDYLKYFPGRNRVVSIERSGKQGQLW